ncbi:MAG: iron ABC transporter permease, partial [Burkholderiaceae bacterium]
MEQDNRLLTATAGEGGLPQARRARRPRIKLNLVGLMVLLLLVQGYPILLIVSSAFNVGDPQAIPATEFGWSNFAQILDHMDWVRNSLYVAVGGTLLATAIGVLLAWIIHRTTVPGSGLLEILIAIPYPLGPLVGALSWSALGSPSSGLINKFFTAMTGFVSPIIDINSMGGIIFVMAIFEAPVAVLMIGAAMQRMDPSLEECSSVFGGGRMRTALRVTLPLMLPAILSSALFLFTSMLGAFAIPAILGVASRFYVITTAIYVLFQGYPPDYPMAAALGLLLIGITAFAVWLYARVLSGRSFTVVSGKNYRPRRVDMGAWTPVLLAIACLYILIALVLPLGVLLVASLQSGGEIHWDITQWTLKNYHYILVDFPTTRQAIVNSLLLGVGTGTIGTALAAIIAWAVHRYHGPDVRALEQVTMLPQAFPRLIFAFGFLWMLLSLPFPLYGTALSVLIVYVIVFLPLAYRSMAGVVVQVDRSMEEAAQMSGAAWWRMMRTVTLPLLRSGLLATWVLIFMVSIREVSASLFLAGPGIQVLGPAIFSFWDSGGLSRVSALAVVQAVIILVALVLVR